MVSLAGIADFLIPSRKAARVAQREALFAHGFAKRLQAQYEAAMTTEENENHWAYARGLSADAAGDPGVRKTIRDRARYEDANNSLCSGMVDTFVDSVYGTGPTLSVETGIDKADASIESRFYEWCDERNVFEKFRLAYRDDSVAGEGLLLKVADDEDREGPAFDLVNFECDRVCDPYGDQSDPYQRDGVRLSRSLNPQSYYILDQHPGDNSGYALTEDGQWYPADRVIHLSRKRRPEQIRGVSPLTPALYVFATFRRFLFATVAAAETAASNAAVVKTTSSEIIQDAIAQSPGGVNPVSSVLPLDVVEMPKRNLLTLPAGWDIGQMVAQHPNATIEMFHRIAVMEVGRGYGMPYNVAAADSSDHNYASGRLDWQAWGMVVDRERTLRLDRAWKFGIVRDWYRQAQLIPGYLHPACREIPFSDLNLEFLWASLGHADPKKEAEAIQLRLDAHVSTVKRECALLGLDYRAVLRQQQKESKVIATLAPKPEEQPAAKPARQSQEAAA